MLKVEWLGDTTIIDPKYKEYLITWAKGYAAGPSLTPKYGDWSGDKSGTWDCFRDGQVLSAFAKWWNAKKGTSLGVGTVASSGMCKNVLAADFTPAHRDALDAFAAELKLVAANQWAADFSPQSVPPAAPVFDFVPQDIPPASPGPTCGPNEILVGSKCVPAPQITTPPATPAASEKKTPWGLILGGAALVGAAAWAMGVFGGGLVAENPSEHRAHPTKYKVSVRQHGSSRPSRTWGPFDTKEEAISLIEQKRDEARKNGWNVVFSLLEPTENWGSSGPLRPSGWGRDNPRSETWKLVPKTIGSVDHSTGKFYPNAPVTRVEAFPPGKHPPSAIRKDVTLVMIHTPYGVRQYGFADAFIDSSLRMRVKLSPGQERDEVVARWPSARGGRAG